MMESFFAVRPAWAEINLDHLSHNINQFKTQIDPAIRIMAVVKADGYGHGAVAIAKTALQAGASSLAVAFVEEGIELRKAGLDVPILILGYTDPVQFPLLVQYMLTPTVFGLDTALEFSELAAGHQVTLPLHLKIDTGMGRVGLLPAEVVEVAARISRLPGLKIEGCFTHFAAAEDTDGSYTEEQQLLFNRLIDRCRESGIIFPLIHAANSAAAINHPTARYNLIRLGLAMYGCYPAPGLKEKGVDLRAVLTLKSKVILVKKVPAGSAISYGCTYHTKEEALIATIPIGYADGYSRLLSNKSHVLVRGCRAKVIGTVCMDQLMIDVSHIPGVCLNDEVILYGRQGNEQVSIEEAAGLIGTINYELLCSVDKRVPRYYFKAGKISSIHDFTGDRVIARDV